MAPSPHDGIEYRRADGSDSRGKLYDDRDGSSTHGAVMEIETGRDAYRLITIPAGVWSGFLGLGAEPALVANCATAPHDPAEIDRRDEHDTAIPYRWSARAGA